MHKLNLEKNRRLNSFSLYLLLLAVMFDYELLPNLQAQRPHSVLATIELQSRNKECSYYLESEIGFQDNISNVVWTEAQIQNKKQTAAEILMLFFRFYTTRFDTKKMFVNVSGEGEPFEDKACAD